MTAARVDVPLRVQQVLDALPAARPSGEGWTARCPAHEDGSPSLVVSVGEDGYSPVVWCHGGCTYADVRAALIGAGVAETALRPATPGQRPSTPAQPPASGPTAGAPHTTGQPSDDELADWLERCEWALSDKLLAKLAGQRAGLDAGALLQAELGWDVEHKCYTLPIRELTTGSVVGYRRSRWNAEKKRHAWTHPPGGIARLFAPQHVSDRRVLLCEGEWDALMAWQHGFNAVATTGGAGTVPAVELLEALRGREVFIAFDCDDAGRDGAEKWARRLAGMGCRVRVVDLGLDDKGDVSDWFAQRSAGDLRELLDATPSWTGEPEELAVGEDEAILRAMEKLRVQREATRRVNAEEAARGFEPLPRQTLKEALANRPEEPPELVERLHRRGYNTTITAKYKTGKTTLGGNLLRSLADGVPFLGRFPVQQPVGRIGLLNYELTDSDMLGWLDAQGIENTDRVAILNLRGRPFSLAHEQGQQELVSWCREMGVETLLLDPHRRAFAGFGEEGSNDDVNRFTAALDEVKEQAGVTDLFLFVHTGRAEASPGSERARGATALDDWADQRWVLTRGDEDETRFLYADGRMTPVSEFALVFDPGSRRLVAGEGNRRSQKADAKREPILRVLEDAGDEGANTTQLEHAFGSKNGALSKVLPALVGEGYVVVRRGGRGNENRYWLPKYAPKDVT